MAATHDIAVIGAGFAGLACARRAAERGLSVVVLDRQSGPGERVHTTGILVREAWEEWAAPAPLVRRISRVRVYTPGHRFVELDGDRYFFMATDTGSLMRHLVDETRGAGAEVRFGEKYEGAARNGAGLILESAGVACRFLVGADGARSRVAESFGLDRNLRVLKGVEWEFEPAPGDGDCLHCFIDPDCAPGYIGWVVPGVNVTQVGLAVHRHRKADVQRFIDRIEPLFGLSRRRLVGEARRGHSHRRAAPPVPRRARAADRGRGGDGVAADRRRDPQCVPPGPPRRRRHSRPPGRRGPAPGPGRAPRVSEPCVEARRPLGVRPPARVARAGSRAARPRPLPQACRERLLRTRVAAAGDNPPGQEPARQRKLRISSATGPGPESMLSVSANDRGA